MASFVNFDKFIEELVRGGTIPPVYLHDGPECQPDGYLWHAFWLERSLLTSHVPAFDEVGT